MDGRQPSGFMYTNTNVSDHAKHDEYNKWYQAVHFPDVTEPGIFVNPLMFHNAKAELGSYEGRFLAFYETYWQDVNAAYAEFSKTVKTLRSELRIHASTMKRFFGVYNSVATIFGTERRRRSQSLLAIRLSCSDKSKVSDLKQWYTETQLPDFVAEGIFHTGTFGEMIDGEPYVSLQDKTTFKWIVLYESDIGDPQAIVEEINRRSSHSDHPPYVDAETRSIFYRHTA